MKDRWWLVAATAFACLGADSAFGALYHSWTWLPPTAAVVVVVIAVSEGVRRSRVPTAFGPLVAAVAVLMSLCWIEAGNPLPATRERAVLGTLLHQGASVVHRYAAPVPGTRGAVLLAAIGIAAVALVVDLCVLTLDRAALAAPPLLAVFVVSALLTHHGVGWWPFVLVTAGLLLLLAAEGADHRRRWGQHFGGDPVPGSRSLAPGAGRRLGVAAVAIAVVAPLLIPGLHAARPRSGGGSGSSGGNGTSATTHLVTVNPLVSIASTLQHQTDQELVVYHSTAKHPGYLRLTALDDFDGTTFTPAQLTAASSHPVTQRLSPLVGLSPAGQPVVTTEVEVGQLDQHWAPVPENPISTDLGSSWLWDLPSSTVWSTEQDTEGLDYTVRSVGSEPSASVLQAVSFADLSSDASQVLPADLQVTLPPAVLPKVKALAQRLLRPTPFATAVAIQQHFLSPPFSYDLSVPATDSADALANFLFTTHQGFCQQYAAAMTILSRLDGIPARVAVGFTSGEPVGGDQWVVSGGDAHAWPELFFPNVGWLPFEPTPRSDGQTHSPSYAAVGGADGHGRGGGSHNRFNRTGPKTTSKPRPRHPTKGEGGAAIPQAQRSGGVGGDVGWTVLALIVLAIGLPACWRLTTRQRHAHPHGPVGAAHAAWDELKDSAIDLGIDWPQGLTPRATTGRLMRSVPALAGVGDCLERLAIAEQQARYAPAVTVDVLALPADVRVVRSLLRDRAGRLGRVRAGLFPRSSISSVRQLLDHWSSIGWRQRRSS